MTGHRIWASRFLAGHSTVHVSKRHTWYEQEIQYKRYSWLGTSPILMLVVKGSGQFIACISLKAALSKYSRLFLPISVREILQFIATFRDLILLAQ